MHTNETKPASKFSSPAYESPIANRGGQSKSSLPSRSSSQPLSFYQIKQFQRTVGNQLLSQWLETSPTIQRKSTVIQRSTKDITMNLGVDEPPLLSTSTEDQEQQDREKEAKPTSGPVVVKKTDGSFWNYAKVKSKNRKKKLQKRRWKKIRKREKLLPQSQKLWMRSASRCLSGALPNCLGK